ncbi:hypothetical protein FCIRC_7041 [Fusarium circinatum]|uniref:Uncharacterized protein n=1 Tax=Fusarium circinatum TaxID=48490 RepID=A0A8H5TVM7_FUSCI|nr:hypothetical protein FCIRC_7041 [Fusarium circinatum]
MEPSDNTRSTENRSYLGRVDDGLNDIFRLDEVWEAAWDEPIGDENATVLVDAKQYAAFLKWQAENLEGESTNALLEPKGKPMEISEKKENTDPNQYEKGASNVQSSQHDAEDRRLSACGDSSSGDEAQAWCDSFEKKMNKMGIRRQFRDILKLLELSQLMDNDMRLFELVKKKDDEERQKSPGNITN